MVFLLEPVFFPGDHFRVFHGHTVAGVNKAVTVTPPTHIHVGETKRPQHQVQGTPRSGQTQPTAVGEHCLNTGHSEPMKNTKVITSEEDCLKGKSKKPSTSGRKDP